MAENNNQFSQRYIDLKKKTDNDEYLSGLTLKQLEALLEEAEETRTQFKNLELIVKRDANSLYGTSASIYFSLGDFDIAEDICYTGSWHYTVIVDKNINKFVKEWGPEELAVIQEFYPQVTELRKFTEYVRDSVNDICVYGDTDSRYIDIGRIYELMGIELPPYTPEGDKELSDFVLFLMDRFIKDLIKRVIDEDLTFRNGNKGYLRMAHERTTRRGVFQAKKKYVLADIYKDGKLLDKPKLKAVGVELRKGELNKRIKKIIETLIEKFMLKGYDVPQLRNECIKIINYIKMRKEKDCIYRISAVSGTKDIAKDENGVYRSKRTHFQMKIALSWYNFIERNNLWNEYKPPFEGQKMNFYYDRKGDVIGIPDDVDINSVPGLPEPDWNMMLNQILIKPLLRYIYEDKAISVTDIENFLLNIKKLSF
jgi:hypothetical protein